MRASVACTHFSCVAIELIADVPLGNISLNLNLNKSES